MGWKVICLLNLSIPDVTYLIRKLNGGKSGGCEKSSGKNSSDYNQHIWIGLVHPESCFFGRSVPI